MAVEIKNNYLILKPGETYNNVSADFSSYGEGSLRYGVSWVVDDKSIVSVTNSAVIGLTASATFVAGSVEGETNVTVISNNNAAARAICRVVVANEIVSVTGVVLDMYDVFGLPGQRFVLKSTITPSDATNKQVWWSCSDDSILSISPHPEHIGYLYVTALKEGIATVTVTTNDGSYSDSAIFNINTKAQAIKVLVSPKNINLKLGQRATLSAEVYPANAEDGTIVWSVPSDGAVTTVTQDGIIEAIRLGSSWVKASTSNGKASATVNVTVTKEPEPEPEPEPTPSANRIIRVDVTSHSLEMTEGKQGDIYAVVVDTYGTDNAGVRCQQTRGTGSVNIFDAGPSNPSIPTSRKITIQPLRAGDAEIKISSITDSTKYAVINIAIKSVEEPGKEDDDEPIIIPEPVFDGGLDSIIRIDYKDDGSFSFTKLYEGNLGFDTKHPIESVVYHETDEIQKIYWVDGKNVLRSMNFMADNEERQKWVWDNTYFDSNKGTDFLLTCNISKDYAGNRRPNGVIQYVLTYYNEHGQESGPVWTSDLIYLSPSGTGGAADDTNTCRIVIKFTQFDAKFSNYRVYSIFRSSEDGPATSYIVSEGSTTGSEITVIDDYANQTGEDASRLLYLGSQPVVAGTITHKDQTLFLGDISGSGRGELYDDIEKVIKTFRNSRGVMNEGLLEFDYADGPALPDSDELYPYENQLKYTSSEILTFKGGEKYRFALVFKFADGTSTDAFWIGDAENDLYPKMDDGKIQRVIAKFNVPSELISIFYRAKYLDINGQPKVRAIQLMIAEATYADRSVKAQGILNPTVFNVWERYNNRIYAQASWITRPRNSGFACRHFEPIHNSIYSDGEIDCNYWETTTPTPYYRLKDYNTSAKSYYEEYDGMGDYDAILIIYGIGVKSNGTLGVYLDYYSPSVSAVKVVMNDGSTAAYNSLYGIDFTDTYGDVLARVGKTHQPEVVQGYNNYYTLTFYDSGNNDKLPAGDAGKQAAYSFVHDFLLSKASVSEMDIVDDSDYFDWCDHLMAEYKANPPSDSMVHTKFKRSYINPQYPAYYNTSWEGAFDYASGSSSGRFKTDSKMMSSTSWDYTPSYYKKHLMFVDENVVTLNSPELEYNLVSFDKAEGYKLRIVGVANITSSSSDYIVDATPGKLPGENLIQESFNSLGGHGTFDGIVSWPLWLEYGLKPKEEFDGDGNQTIGYDDLPEDPKERDSSNYEWGNSKYSYWLHMWNHAGKINGFTDDENNDYSNLRSKVFANLRVSSKTYYKRNDEAQYVYDLDRASSLRIFNYISGQYVGIDVGGDIKYYDANIKTSIMTPGSHKYPVLYSIGRADTSEHTDSNNYDMMLNTPVPIEYRSSPHAVITLPTVEDRESGLYYQRTLPDFTGKDKVRTYPYEVPVKDTSAYITGALLPWINNNPPTSSSYPYVDYVPYPNQPEFTVTGSEEFNNGDKYIYIGEIYYDYSGDADDMRYGGTSEAAIQNNRFIVAGPQYRIADIGTTNRVIIADRGDTYFQRWDCLKTKPYNESTNGVIDITSVMIETHINVDGRTDLQRGVSKLASIDYENFGVLNNVYSQKDRYNQRRDLNEDFNLDSYRSTITWTLQKNDLAQVDEWMHITLANTLKLDGDRGICRALRRLQNSIIAFQDKGISEILFNSRTQLSTTDGVPVEIANSGKVDGKRYITNKYGCTNKWSIVEGKTGLYFIDNINKAFCLFSGNGVDSLSDKLGFGIWFKDANVVEPWMPYDFKNMVSFYDREHSDIYLVKNTDDEMPCLVYNENLQAFTSFFDYSGVPMITNVRDRLVSFRDNKLWLQNEGLYCNFFGKQYDFWVQYRVTPDPFADKIWTNFDYRADFYHLLDKDATPVLPEEYLINGDRYGDSADIYKENETFTCYKVWDEYQTTGAINLRQDCCMIDPVRKKFRIWRVAIARAMRDRVNIHGLDRIRNPWINLLLRKHVEGRGNQYLMQLHDIVVKYFE